MKKMLRNIQLFASIYKIYINEQVSVIIPEHNFNTIVIPKEYTWYMYLPAHKETF